jgi:drug/metabolite transporter (DMT)-like permease
VGQGDTRRGRLFVALAAIAWSTAGLFQRELTVNLGTQLAGRALFAMLGIGVFVAATERGRSLKAFRAIGRPGLAIAALMAVSSGSFIAALNYTSVANVLFLQGLAPVLAAVLGMAIGERVERRTWIVMAVAVTGVAVMVGGPSRPSALGFSLSLLMSISFAGTIVITRHQRQVSMAPATWLSQALVFVFAAPFASASEVGWKDLALLAGLGVTQIGLGLIFLTIGARLIPAAEVALITLLEIVLGPLWVWIALGEQPSATTLVGGAIVLAAVVIQTVGAPDEPPVPPP